MKTITIAGTEYVRSAEAARYLDLSRTRVSVLVKQGILQSARIDSMVLVTLSSVMAYKVSDRKPGRKAR